MQIIQWVDMPEDDCTGQFLLRDEVRVALVSLMPGPDGYWQVIFSSGRSRCTQPKYTGFDSCEEAKRFAEEETVA